MDYDADLEAARKSADLAHRLQLEMIEVVFRVAKEMEMDPAEVAQAINVQGMHAVLGPLMSLQYERNQAKHVAMQQRAIQEAQAAFSEDSTSGDRR